MKKSSEVRWMLRSEMRLDYLPGVDPPRAYIATILDNDVPKGSVRFTIPNISNEALSGEPVVLLLLVRSLLQDTSVLHAEYNDSTLEFFLTAETDQESLSIPGEMIRFRRLKETFTRARSRHRSEEKEWSYLPPSARVVIAKDAPHVLDENEPTLRQNIAIASAFIEKKSQELESEMERIAEEMENLKTLKEKICG